MNRRSFLTRASIATTTLAVAPLSALTTLVESPDDTARIQAEIDRAESEGRGIVLRNRTFRLNQTISIRANDVLIENCHFTGPASPMFAIHKSAGRCVFSGNSMRLTR